MKNWRVSSWILGLGIVLAYLPSSQAAFIEPILGYSMATVEDGTGADDTHKGVYMGGRLGMGIPIVPMLWLALDGGITTGGKYTAKPTDVDTDTNRTLLGATLGVDIPVIPIIDRVWLGYNFIDKLSFDNATNQKVTGSSTKLGLGLKFVPFISLNIEYILTNYSKNESSGVKTDIDTNAKTVLVSVSLPLP